MWGREAWCQHPCSKSSRKNICTIHRSDLQQHHMVMGRSTSVDTESLIKYLSRKTPNGELGSLLASHTIICWWFFCKHFFRNDESNYHPPLPRLRKEPPTRTLSDLDSRFVTKKSSKDKYSWYRYFNPIIGRQKTAIPWQIGCCFS